MIVGAVADLHGYLPAFPEEQLDLLLVAGDIGVLDDCWLEAFGNPGMPYSLAHFNDWLNEAGCPVVGVAGNHDFGLAGVLGDQRARLLDWTYLLDETVQINGLKIHGSPWTPTFGRWAFMEDEEKLYDRWSKIPRDVDILITHGPPVGVMDIGFGGKHAGSVTLGARLEELDGPMLHVFGHIHSGRGVTNDDTTYTANVSYVGEDYKPQGEMFIFDL